MSTWYTHLTLCNSSLKLLQATWSASPHLWHIRRDRIEISSLAAVPVPDSVKARAAGYAEGQLHWNRIADYWHNYK